MTDLSGGVIYDRLTELALKVQKLEKRLEILESKPKQPVDRRLVEEALTLALEARNYSSWTMGRFSPIVDLLRRALEGEQDVKTE